jgi:hypothetical protein
LLDHWFATANANARFQKFFVSGQNDALATSAAKQPLGSSRPIPTLSCYKNIEPEDRQGTTYSPPPSLPMRRVFFTCGPENPSRSTIIFLKHGKHSNEEQLLTQEAILYSLRLCKLKV